MVVFAGNLYLVSIIDCALFVLEQLKDIGPWSTFHLWWWYTYSWYCFVEAQTKSLNGYYTRILLMAQDI